MSNAVVRDVLRRWCYIGVLYLLLISLFFIFTWVVFSDWQKAKEDAIRSTCMGNLQQIHLALSSYSDFHGSPPPLYVTDKQGRRMHSWRVVILPFLGLSSLHERYDFGEPWDGTNNLRLLRESPYNTRIFRCPHMANRDSYYTNHVAVEDSTPHWVGDSTPRLFSGLGIDQNKIIIVKTAHLNIAWTEPRKLMLTQVSSGIGLGNQHPDGFHYLSANNRIRMFSAPAELQSLQKQLCLGTTDVIRRLLSKESTAKRVELLRRFLKNQDPYFRRNAAIYLGDLGIDALPVLPALRDACNDENITVRESAMRAIRAISGQEK